MRQGIFAAGVAAASAVAFLACGDETPLSGPSGTTNPAGISRVTPNSPTAQQSTSSGLAPSFVYVVYPGDSTTDPCFAGEFCGVQRRAAGGIAAVFCPNGPGTCPTQS